MQRRAHALTAVLINPDLWVRSKAFLITLADFQGGFVVVFVLGLFYFFTMSWED